MNIKRIDGADRFYEVDGVRYPSCTTVLGVIDKPALKHWYRKEALLEVERNWGQLGEHMKQGLPLQDALRAVTAAAKSKPEAIMQEALDVGSEAHNILEGIAIEWVKAGAMPSTHVAPKEGQTATAVAHCVTAFYEWAKAVKLKPVKSELTVYSKKLGFAGTLDLLATINGQLAIADYKSSKAIYPEYDLQLSAYKMAYEEMTGEKIKSMYVVRLGKTDGAFETKKVKNYAKNIKAFKGAIQLWQWQQLHKKKSLK